MSQENNTKCSVCKKRFVFKEISSILNKDLQICVSCLEEQMRRGEIQSFGEKEYEQIVKLLDGLPRSRKEDDDNFSEEKIAIQDLDTDLYLLQFGKDLTKLARQNKLTPVIGRKKEIEETILILSRKFKTNPLLLGEPGVGKTAIIEGLAQKIVDGDVPSNLQNKRLIELNMGSIVAGSKYRGEFEIKVKKIIEEVQQQKNIILFLDEFHTLSGAGLADGGLDASDILKPSLARGEIQLVGATTFDEYRTKVEKDKALSRRLSTVNVQEPSIDESVEIINGLLPVFEEHNDVVFEDNVVRKAVELSKRYLTERFLPDKAIDLIDETAAQCKIVNSSPNYDFKSLELELEEIRDSKNKFILGEQFEKAKSQLLKEKKLETKLEKEKEKFEKEKKKKSVVTVANILETLERKTGIPVTDTDSTEKEKLKTLDRNLRKYVKGQEKAIDLITMAVRRSKLKLKDPNRPTGVFMFLGPTGVGKTELGRALAIELFGDKDAMIKIDMSEFQEKHSVSKLIGSPPGYVGHSDGGKLTNLLRQKPFSIVLLDEVEKAHPDVLNVLLQVFEDGVLTDNKGKTLDAKNAIFILTSNAGSKLYSKTNGLGFASKTADEKSKDLEKEVVKQIRKESFFSPEFLNRLDSIVVFNPLTEDAMKEIVEKQTTDLQTRLEKEGYKLEFSPEVIEYLKKEGYRPEFGARESKRKVENITNLLANRILEEEKDSYQVVINNNELVVI